MTDRLLGSVFQRSVRDQRRMLVGFSIGLVLYVALIASFYPTVRDQREQFEKVLDAYPPAMKKAFGLTDIASAPGYLHSELFSVMLPLLFLIYGIGRAADAIAGEEERGALDILLTHPVSRSRALAGKAAGIAVGLVAMGVVLWASLAIGGAVFGMGLDLVALAEEVLLLVLVALAFSAVTLLVACLRGRKALALAVGSAVAVGSYLLQSFGALVDALATARRASPFYYFAESSPLTRGFEPTHAVVLAAIAAVATAIAFWAFARRDVGV